MIRYRISPRTVRFLELWLIGFMKFMGIITVAAVIGGIIGWAVIKLAIAYGAAIVIGIIALAWVVLLGGVFAGAIASERLADMERREAELMDQLKKDGQWHG